MSSERKQERVTFGLISYVTMRCEITFSAMPPLENQRLTPDLEADILREFRERVAAALKRRPKADEILLSLVVRLARNEGVSAEVSLAVLKLARRVTRAQFAE